jgi:ribosomal protein S18 acetylase RimI-like enzyme
VILDELERYYDTVPRRDARAEDFGPLTLFVRDSPGWPFYARPTRSASAGAPRLADVVTVRDRQRALGVAESFEWVHETTPSLRAAVEASGLAVREHPLMVLEAPDTPVRSSVPAGTDVRVLGPGDPALPTALALGRLAFADAGTRIGSAGRTELAAVVRERDGDGSVDRIRDRITAGVTVVAAAVDGDGVSLCSGMHQPVDGVTEIVGVGTLPAARRRGLALAVTAALVADARKRGVTTVFLSAGDEDVARIYGRLGFRRVGTALIAEV